MKLWTIRHTRPYNPKDVCYGRLDFDVSPSFQQESDDMLKAFMTLGAKPSRLYCSPLTRCKKLANKVGTALSLPPEPRDALLEMNFGRWEGKKLTEAPRDEMAAWIKDLRGFKFPDGESFHEVDNRVTEFLDTLPDDGEFLWVTHVGVIAALQHAACGLPDEDFVEGRFSYTMVTCFNFTRDAAGHYKGTFEKLYDGIQMPPLNMGKL